MASHLISSFLVSLWLEDQNSQIWLLHFSALFGYMVGFSTAWYSTMEWNQLLCDSAVTGWQYHSFIMSFLKEVSRLFQTMTLGNADFYQHIPTFLMLDSCAVNHVFFLFFAYSEFTHCIHTYVYVREREKTEKRF